LLKRCHPWHLLLKRCHPTPRPLLKTFVWLHAWHRVASVQETLNKEERDDSFTCMTPRCECPREEREAFLVKDQTNVLDIRISPRGHAWIHSKGSTGMARKAKDEGIPLSVPTSLKRANLTPRQSPRCPTTSGYMYWVAMISRLLKIIGLFRRISSLL